MKRKQLLLASTLLLGTTLFAQQQPQQAGTPALAIETPQQKQLTISISGGGSEHISTQTDLSINYPLQFNNTIGAFVSGEGNMQTIADNTFLKSRARAGFGFTADLDSVEQTIGYLQAGPTIGFRYDNNFDNHQVRPLLGIQLYFQINFVNDWRLYANFINEFEDAIGKQGSNSIHYGTYRIKLQHKNLFVELNQFKRGKDNPVYGKNFILTEIGAGYVFGKNKISEGLTLSAHIQVPQTRNGAWEGTAYDANMFLIRTTLNLESLYDLLTK